MTVRCPACRSPLTVETPAAGASVCAACGVHLEVSVFPALFRGPDPGRSSEPVVSGQESACFYHPGKRAVVVCDHCGRFLCALCDLELNGRHTCPPCLDQERIARRNTRLESQRTRYDRVVLALAIYPMLLMFYPTFFTAPIALFMAFRYWNAPASLVHRVKIRTFLAILVAAGQIVCWILLIGFLATHWGEIFK